MLMSNELGNEIPRITFIPVYRYGHPNSDAQKRKNTFFYTDIFYHRPCFFLLNQIKINFQLRKHILSIVNHSKAWEICSL